MLTLAILAVSRYIETFTPKYGLHQPTQSFMKRLTSFIDNERITLISTNGTKISEYREEDLQYSTAQT